MPALCSDWKIDIRKRDWRAHEVAPEMPLCAIFCAVYISLIDFSQLDVIFTGICQLDFILDCVRI